MRPNPIRSITFRLVAAHTALMLVALVLLAVLLYAGLDLTLRADLDARLGETSQSALALVELEHGELVFEETEPERITPDPLPGIPRRRGMIRLLNRDGRVVSEPPELAQLPVSPGLVAAAERSGGFFTTAWLSGERVRLRTVPVMRQGKCLGALQVMTSQEPIESTLANLVRLLCMGGIPALLLVTVVGYRLARQAMEPVHAITKTARAIGASSLSQRLRVSGTGDELAELAASLNEMLDRIEEAYRRQREFAANASHELRTPLASIKGEAALARAVTRTPEEMRAGLAVIEEEADRLTGLVEDLLLLARLDRGDLLRAAPTGLDELAHEVTGRLVQLAREQGVAVRAEAPDPVVVRGDEVSLRRVLQNLVVNAVEHAGATEVCVSVAPANGCGTVLVRDNGRGIPAEHADRVFERFYQVDGARSGRGAGLGLSLCRDVVLAHGGAIHLESRPDSGTTVTFTVPLLRDEG